MSSCQCEQYSGESTVRQILMDEHRVIERVLDAVERMVNDGCFDRSFLVKALDFFRNFADGCHHAKEEGELFPELERAGLPRDGGPIGCMLHEHDEGRGYIRAIQSNLDSAGRGDRSALAEVARAARQYVVMLRQHIQKEDNVLFVLAENMLLPQQKEKILKGFASKENEPQSTGQRGRYLKLAEELERWDFQKTCI